MDYGLKGSWTFRVNAGGNQDAFAPQPVWSWSVGKKMMLRCPWGTSNHTWGYTVRCCGDLALWSRKPPPWASSLSLSLSQDSVVLLHLPDVWHSKALFCQLSQTSMGGGEKLKRRLVVTCGLCGLWLVSNINWASGYDMLCKSEVVHSVSSEIGGCCWEHSVSFLLSMWSLVFT